MLTSQKHLPNREQHLLLFYVHRIQLCILAEKSEFPIPQTGPVATSDPGTMEPLEYSKQGMLL